MTQKITKIYLVKSNDEILAAMTTQKKYEIALETFGNLGKENLSCTVHTLDQIFEDRAKLGENKNGEK